jgi:hypothetical protein
MANYNFMEKQICWTTTPYDKAKLAELPYIEMVGYQQTYSDAIVSLNFWKERVTGDANPYKGLYMGEPRSTYILPFFSDYHHGVTQNWQENQGPLGELVKKATDALETVGKVVYPAAGILYPKSYAGSQPATYTFGFTLLNTNAGTSPSDDIQNNILMNASFVEDFMADNLHDQNGALSVLPPLIYEVYIPGVRWAPAAVVSNVTITNKGSMNDGSVFGFEKGYIYPDAWDVQITITELINESKKIWADATRNTPHIGAGFTTRILP